MLALAIERDGDVVVGGIFAGTLDFGAGPMTNSRAPFGGTFQGDGFLARFTTSGALVYQKQIMTSDGTDLHVAAASDGGTFVFGGFGEDADFGDGMRVTRTTAQYDTYFARLDAGERRRRRAAARCERRSARAQGARDDGRVGR